MARKRLESVIAKDEEVGELEALKEKPIELVSSKGLGSEKSTESNSQDKDILRLEEQIYIGPRTGKKYTATLREFDLDKLVVKLNPRIQKYLSENSPSMLSLMKDIEKQHQQIPGLVVYDQDNFDVLRGSRRLFALKMLRDKGDARKFKAYSLNLNKRNIDELSDAIAIANDHELTESLSVIEECKSLANEYNDLMNSTGCTLTQFSTLKSISYSAVEEKLVAARIDDDVVASLVEPSLMTQKVAQKVVRKIESLGEPARKEKLEEFQGKRHEFKTLEQFDDYFNSLFPKKVVTKKRGKNEVLYKSGELKYSYSWHRTTSGLVNLKLNGVSESDLEKILKNANKVLGDTYS